MRYILTKKFQKQYAKAPEVVKKAFDKCLKLFLENSHHPSLDAKQYKDTNQARVTLSWRFYYDVEEDCYVITTITKHPK